MMFGEWGYGLMMGGGAGVFGSLVVLVLFIDLILVGIWLWKEISKK